MASDKYPCDTCVKVGDPNMCENKNCKDWKHWFLRRWAEIQGFGKKYGCKENVDGGERKWLN